MAEASARRPKCLPVFHLSLRCERRGLGIRTEPGNIQSGSKVLTTQPSLLLFHIQYIFLVISYSIYIFSIYWIFHIQYIFFVAYFCHVRSRVDIINVRFKIFKYVILMNYQLFYILCRKMSLHMSSTLSGLLN